MTHRPAILVADAAALFRTGVRRLLERETDFVVVEAADADEAVAAARAAEPAFALVDLDLPAGGAIQAVARIRDVRPATQTIVWSFAPEPTVVLEAIRAGATGFLPKDLPTDALVRALRGVPRGHAPLTLDVAAGMIDAIQRDHQHVHARVRAAALSVREREVLELLAVGARNRDIGAQLAISEFTAKRHVQNILHKLGVPTRAAAAALFQSLQTTAVSA